MLKEVSDYIRVMSEKKYPNVVISGKKYSFKPFLRGNVYDTQEVGEIKESIDFYVKEFNQELDNDIVDNYGCEYMYTVKYHKYPRRRWWVSYQYPGSKKYHNPKHPNDRAS